MERERGYRGEARDEESDRRFLIGLIALVVVMDLFQSAFWLLSSASRFARRHAARWISSADRQLSPAMPAHRNRGRAERRQRPA